MQRVLKEFFVRAEIKFLSVMLIKFEEQLILKV